MFERVTKRDRELTEEVALLIIQNERLIARAQVDGMLASLYKSVLVIKKEDGTKYFNRRKAND